MLGADGGGHVADVVAAVVGGAEMFWLQLAGCVWAAAWLAYFFLFAVWNWSKERRHAVATWLMELSVLLTVFPCLDYVVGNATPTYRPEFIVGTRVLNGPIPSQDLSRYFYICWGTAVLSWIVGVYLSGDKTHAKGQPSEQAKEVEE